MIGIGWVEQDQHLEITVDEARVLRDELSRIIEDAGAAGNDG